MKCIKPLIWISAFVSNYAFAQISIQTERLKQLKEIIKTYYRKRPTYTNLFHMQ